MSGAELIGQVPPHWSVKPLRILGRLFKGSGGSKADAVEEGVPCVRYGELYTAFDNFIDRARTCISQERAAEYTPIEFGDVLFAASGETIEEIGKSAVNLVRGARCGSDLIVFRPTQPFAPRFLGYATDAAPVAAQKSLAGRGSTVKHIYPDELREVLIAIPPMGEQQLIADFLDRETARIDALIAAKQRLLELLAEKRKAIIATAVTRGRDPNVKLRDSSVPWLGEIPVHWELRRAKYLFRQSALPVAPGDEIVTCFRDGQVTQRRKRREEGFTNADLEVGYQGIRQGQLVLHSMDAFAGAIGVSDSDGRCSPEYIICDPLDGGVVAPEYFGPLLRAMALAGFIQASCPAVRERAPRIRFNDFGEMYLPMPPQEEQRAIIEHIARDTAKLDAARAATERTIALLKERRSALIAAAVTGQLDVTMNDGAVA